jgi:TrmH family RNA methyltransferase
MHLKLIPYKKRLDYSYSFGVFPTLELMAHKPDQVARVLMSPKGERNAGVEQIKKICASRKIPVEMADGLVNKLSGKENAYAVGVFKKYECGLDKEKSHLALVGPRDPGNLGTIMRTMLGFGMEDLVIIKPAADIFDPKTVRAAMGALFQIRFKYFDSFADYANLFRHNFYPFMSNGKTKLREVVFKKPYSLIFGSESARLDDSYLKTGTSVQIPQNSQIDSLNLAVAVGIGLWESRWAMEKGR